MVMTVYAPDSKESLEVYEESVSSVVKVLREGRRVRAKDFNITGDFNAALGLMCADETRRRGADENVWSLMLARERQGPSRFQKKNMWYGTMKEFEL